MKFKYLTLNIRFIVILILITFKMSSQTKERPFILVTAEERNQVLEKIETQDWAKDIFKELKGKADVQVKSFIKNPKTYLEKLPFNWSEGQKNSFPPFYKTYHVENGVQKNLDNATDAEKKNMELLIKYLQVALDCGMMYYLTQDEKYAYVASSILYAFAKSVQKSQLSDWHGRGGWLFPYDGFREVRVLGYKVPLIYDFTASYLKNGGQAFDIIKNKKVDFPVDELQDVCRTYADITINYGQTGSNHSVLESPSLVYNALAMDDEKERETLLSYFLTENTDNQDGLNVMYKKYKNKGDIWPETSQYLNHSTAILAKLLLVVNKYNPSLELGKKYQNILFALPRLDYFVFPNNEIVRWGDGHRKAHAPYEAYENAFVLAQMDSLPELEDKFAPLIKRAMTKGKYHRKNLEALFWYNNDMSEEVAKIDLPRTDRVYHAGIVLQRNFSSTNDPKDGLMGFVGGAHMVHGHAEGMNIELYGEGQVLGVDHGRNRYGKDLHENYSRLFAAHNTVIVNGSSQGEGGWVNLGINTVQLISMEPKVGEEAVSPFHSFSQTSFEDNKGDKAEAVQERTLALIRTSPTTGYYVDVFRSKSKLPDEYHDYLYHNIGDKLVFETKDLNFKKTPKRYMANANGKWRHNKVYRNPGWHFFKNVKSSQAYDKDVKATFTTKKLSTGSVFMQLHIPGFENREYTKVKAPTTFESPKPYDDLPTPTLVIRNKGEAWKNPFVVVFEPFNENEKATIQSVEKLEENGLYKGLKIISNTPTEKLIQYVITQSKNDIFQDEALGIYFQGTFAVISLNENKSLHSIYIGEGDKLIYKNEIIQTDASKTYYKAY
ncbi:heparinase II/III domain-containing protein [Winogradskyella flava]|uniref:Heparinase II/III family protein n=1 Tax=Winogradskyella flava TaxID=1884876 RepID=A0A842ISB4_9FLAO|nr:heparinase II/III family protein [Winogradskyella flava]MBC2844706.1 heparinase II/III family protein [Winogradskyella flava]